MSSNRIARKLWKMALVASSTAVILSSSCAAEDVRAIAVGVESASRELDNNNRNYNNTSFGDWLLNQLNR